MVKTALVTGGSRGIGAAISIALKNAGYTVAANYAGNDKAAHEFKAKTGICCYKWDVGDFEACKGGVAEVQKNIGPIDVLVNNAGITRDGMLHKMTKEQWDDVVRTDLSSLFYMTRQVIDSMRERGFGRIINIGSINGQKGQMGQTNYSAAKAGLIGFTKALAQETARKGITVNCIAPDTSTPTWSPAFPRRCSRASWRRFRSGAWERRMKSRAASSSLAEEACGFMTGATLTANGGQFFAG